jgi:hypothetical protein
MTDLTFSYRPKTWIVLLAVPMLVGLAWFFQHLARTNDQGIIFNHLVEIGPQGATIFYWAMFAILAITVPLILLALWNGVKHKTVITLGADGLTLPKKGLSPQPMTIAYADIVSLHYQSVYSQTFLNLKTKTGKASIAASMFPKKADFETFCAALEERLGRLD